MGEATPAQIVRLIGDQMAKSDQQPVMTGGLAQVAGKAGIQLFITTIDYNQGSSPELPVGRTNRLAFQQPDSRKLEICRQVSLTGYNINA